MNTSFTLKTSLLAAAFAVMPFANAASMAQADYKADKIRINAEYKADKAACGSLAGNANDICVEQAKGKEKAGPGPAGVRLHRQGRRPEQHHEDQG